MGIGREEGEQRLPMGKQFPKECMKDWFMRQRDGVIEKGCKRNFA